MALVLRRGLETNPDFQDRVMFLMNRRALWTFGWLTWTAAALSILYFYNAFAEAHQPAMRFAVFLAVAALGPDLAAQAIEMGVLPGLANRELFLSLHRASMMMTGFAANGLYSLTAFLLALSTRRAYPWWVWLAGVAVGMFGFALSAAVLLNSVAGMFWTNVVLVPTLLLWLAGVAKMSGRSKTHSCLN